MKERDLQKAILDYLNALEGCKAINLAISPEMEVGTPDIVASMHGFALFIEVKTPQGDLSRIQQRRIQQWQEADALVLVLREQEAAFQMLARLNTLTQDTQATLVQLRHRLARSRQQHSTEETDA